MLTVNSTICSKSPRMCQRPTSRRLIAKSTRLYDLPVDGGASYIYRALRLHPDKGGDPELFKEVTHAFVPFIFFILDHSAVSRL